MFRTRVRAFELVRGHCVKTRSAYVNKAAINRKGHTAILFNTPLVDRIGFRNIIDKKNKSGILGNPGNWRTFTPDSPNCKIYEKQHQLIAIMLRKYTWSLYNEHRLCGEWILKENNCFGLTVNFCCKNLSEKLERLQKIIKNECKFISITITKIFLHLKLLYLTWWNYLNWTISTVE